MAGGTVTRTNGQYEIPSLAPGNYNVRAVPLDPATGISNDHLVTGRDIEQRFITAETNFLPTTNKPVTVVANKTTALNFSVTPGTPAFRITRLRTPSSNPELLVVVNSGNAIAAGQSNLFVGVYSPNLPASGAVLSITGNDLNVGPTLFRPSAFVGLNLISVSVSVPTNAIPGLRTLIVQQGTNIAYANGFLKVQPLFPDINNDGFDDRFQRRYFVTPFAADAAPSLDPDHDGYNNYAEYIAGSNPLDPNSVLRIESIRWDLNGATIRWRSAADKRYQVSSRISANSAHGWQNVGGPVTSTGDTMEFFDPSPGTLSRLYRVQAVP